MQILVGQSGHKNHHFESDKVLLNKRFVEIDTTQVCVDHGPDI